MNIKENLGTADRILRVLLAIAFVVSFFHGVISGGAGILLLALSWVLLLTAIFGVCPLYSLLGIRSKMRQESN